MVSQVPVDGVATLEQSIAILSKRIDNLLTKHLSQTDQRIMIALAGVPGSGKSTVSTQLLRSLRKRGIDNVMAVPMDGFHLPKKTLATLPSPETAFRRRGAPFTFDADAFVQTIASLRECPVTQLHDPDLAILLPSFDHAVQDPVQNDICVPSSTKVIIVEGNYLLFDESPWNKASVMFDEKWFVDVPSNIAKQRLVTRHLQAGIETTEEDAMARVEANDLQNGDIIRSKLIQPDIVIVN